MVQSSLQSAKTFKNMLQKHLAEKIRLPLDEEAHWSKKKSSYFSSVYKISVLSWSRTQNVLIWSRPWYFRVLVEYWLSTTWAKTQDDADKNSRDQVRAPCLHCRYLFSRWADGLIKFFQAATCFTSLDMEATFSRFWRFPGGGGALWLWLCDPLVHLP